MADQTISVNITANGEQLKREIDSDITALQRFASAANVSNKTAVAAVQSSIEAQRELLMSVNASSDSYNRLDKVAQSFDQRVQGAATRTGGALNSMARGFSVIESSSHASVRSIDAISNAAAQLAFGFGPTGLLIGAATMVGIALVRAFASPKDAVEELRTKAEQTFSAILDDGSPALKAWVKSTDDLATATRKVAALQKEAQTAAIEGGGGGPIAALQSLRAIKLGHDLTVATASMKELANETTEYKHILDDIDLVEQSKASHKKADKEAAEALRKEAEALKKATEAFQKVLEAQHQLRTAGKGGLNNTGTGNAGVTAAGAATDALGAAGIMGSQGGASFDQITASGADQVTIAAQKQQDKIDALTASVKEYGKAWISAFQAIGSGRNVWDEMAKAAKETLSLIAQEFAKYEIAQGVKSLAEGTWPPNPLALAAAGKHFAAAALFEVVAGASGGAKGGGGGGGSNSSGGDAAKLGAGASANTSPTKMEITFIQKTPDGREISRLRQAIQRQTDLAQPVRVTM